MFHNINITTGVWLLIMWSACCLVLYMVRGPVRVGIG